MTILGIETSCDETAAAVVKSSPDTPYLTVISHFFASSMDEHAKTGGIIPEAAARNQIKTIIPVIEKALNGANLSFTKNNPPDIDAIAVTVGPGLIGPLLVGVETAKTLSFVWNKPIIPVNHLFGHIYANWIKGNQQSDILFPALGLIISGGHTDLVLLKKHKQVIWLGGTRDDAAGEAIDKIGRSINFTYPAGPTFEQAAEKGNPKAYTFPRPIKYDKTFDFSFSGLKTAAIRAIQQIQNIDVDQKNNIARGVQDAIIDVLVLKTFKAIEQYKVRSLLLGGGVASNTALRNKINEKCKEKGSEVQLFVPDKKYCVDNAAMIAAAGYYNPKKTPLFTITAKPDLYFD